MKTINYRHLHQFWIVAQEGSIAAASRRLGIGHPTISAQLRALESALGGRLLLRRPRGVRLTPFGDLVRGYCDEIFRLGSELVEATAQRRGRGTRLRVGMLASVPRSLLYDALRPALVADAGVPVEVTVGDLPTLCRALITGRMHVALSDSLPTRSADDQVYGQLIGETRVALYGIERLAERYRSGFPRSLDGAPMLLPSAGKALRDNLAAWFAELGVRPRVVGEFDDVPTMTGFAARGHGLVPIREALADEARQRYNLARVARVPRVKDRLYALSLGKRMRHPVVLALVEAWRIHLGRRPEQP